MNSNLETCNSSCSRSLGNSSLERNLLGEINEDSLNQDSFTGEISSSNDGSPSAEEMPGDACRVCGDTQAKMHYGVLACFGCKGFFRRALKRATQYVCNNDRKCVIDRYERNTCRYCRLQKCLEVGMDPAAVRPDRDFTGPQHAIRLPVVKKTQKGKTQDAVSSYESSEWSKRLPVEMRTMLMTLLNVEAKVTKGDTRKKAHEVYPLPEHTLRELIADPSKLKGLRTEMRYEPYRMAENSELLLIAYRRLIAAMDWVTYLSEMLGEMSLEDKIALVKSCFATLLVFTFAVRTAEVTDDPDVLCMCNFSFVPRDMAKAYKDSYHLSNGLVDTALNELVKPLRQIKLKEEEIVCLNAVIVLSPHAKDLSPEGSQKVMELRGRIQDTLYHVIKETRSKERAGVQFGNLLLFLTNVTLIANSMCENLQFAQTFSPFGGIPLLTNLFGCFPVEPFSDSFAEPDERPTCDIEIGNEDENGFLGEGNSADAAVQTEPIMFEKIRRKKRRLGTTLLSPIENSEERVFRLLQAPCAYTLTEMFDDVNTDTRDLFVAQIKDERSLLEDASRAQEYLSSSLLEGCQTIEYHSVMAHFPRKPKNFSYPSKLLWNERNSAVSAQQSSRVLASSCSTLADWRSFENRPQTPPRCDSTPVQPASSLDFSSSLPQDFQASLSYSTSTLSDNTGHVENTSDSLPEFFLHNEMEHRLRQHSASKNQGPAVFELNSCYNQQVDCSRSFPYENFQEAQYFTSSGAYQYYRRYAEANDASHARGSDASIIDRRLGMWTERCANA